jgi:hypothetical protein
MEESIRRKVLYVNHEYYTPKHTAVLVGHDLNRDIIIPLYHFPG